MVKDFHESPKYLEARELLPRELWQVFDRFVEEYSYFALVRTGRSWVAYNILADLILAGWRPSGQDQRLQATKEA